MFPFFDDCPLIFFCKKEMSLMLRILFLFAVHNALQPPIWTLMENVFTDPLQGMYVIMNYVL